METEPKPNNLEGKYSKRFKLTFPLYISFTLLLLNYGLYLLYNFYPDFHPSFYVLGVSIGTDCMWFSFIYLLLPSAFIYLGLKFLLKFTRREKYLYSSLAFIPIVAFLLSLFANPLSLLGTLGFIEILSLTIAIPFIRSLHPTETVDLQKMKTESRTKIVELMHKRWLVIFRLSIWGAITLVVGGLSATIALMRSTGVTETGGTSAWGFPMGQLIMIGFLTLTGVIGVGAGITFYCHSVLENLELDLQEN